MTLFLLCLKIFCARIVDVSLGVVRTVITVKGKPFYAAIIAFLEVFIWFLVAKEALSTTIDSLWIPLSYATGYAAGTFIGTKLSRVLIKGVVGVQIITEKLSEEMIKAIKNKKIAVSIINLYQTDESLPTKKMLFIQINNSKLKELTDLVKSMDEKAFIVVNDTRYVQNGFLK